MNNVGISCVVQFIISVLQYFNNFCQKSCSLISCHCIIFSTEISKV